MPSSLLRLRLLHKGQPAPIPSFLSVGVREAGAKDAVVCDVTGKLPDNPATAEDESACALLSVPDGFFSSGKTYEFSAPGEGVTFKASFAGAKLTANLITLDKRKPAKPWGRAFDLEDDTPTDEDVLLKRERFARTELLRKDGVLKTGTDAEYRAFLKATQERLAAKAPGIEVLGQAAYDRAITIARAQRSTIVCVARLSKADAGYDPTVPYREARFPDEQKSPPAGFEFASTTVEDLDTLLEAVRGHAEDAKGSRVVVVAGHSGDPFGPGVRLRFDAKTALQYLTARAEHRDFWKALAGHLKAKDVLVLSSCDLGKDDSELAGYAAVVKEFFPSGASLVLSAGKVTDDAIARRCWLRLAK